MWSWSGTQMTMEALPPSECLRRRYGCLTSSCMRSELRSTLHTSAAHCEAVLVNSAAYFTSHTHWSLWFFHHPFFLISSQRRRPFWGFPDDKSHCALGRHHYMDSARQLQVLLHHGRYILPLRSTELLHEVRLLDLRRKHGGPGPGGSLRGP